MLRIENTINGTINRLRCRAAFTLVEVLVTVMIFTILMAAIQTVLLVGQSSWQTNSVRAELGQELRKAIEWMKDDLRQTGDAAISDGPEDADDSDNTSITFRMAIGITDGSIQWDEDDEDPPNEISTQFILGGADSNQLLKNVVVDDGDDSTNTTTVLAQNIRTLVFRRMSTAPDIMEVELGAQKVTADRRTINLGINFEVQMRN